MKRFLGRSGIEVSALGMGCWAIGGPFSNDGKAVGWGEVDDAESTRAIHAALEQGVNFFDTANVYGAGHSERVLGNALAGQRPGRDCDQVQRDLQRGNVRSQAATRRRPVSAGPVTSRYNA